MAFHYGWEIFGGLKVYRHAGSSTRLFRPKRNAWYFISSAERLKVAPFPGELFLTSLDKLVTLGQARVSRPDDERNLYLRPFEIISESYFEVHEVKNHYYDLIASLIGTYYPAPVKLWVTPNYIRAVPGGTGTVKCGGNYTASLAAINEAAVHNCERMLYLDGTEHR